MKVDGTPSGGLAGRLDEIAWGLLVFLVGIEFLPSGGSKAALVAVAGVLFLGLNAIRASHHLALGWFTTILGAVTLTAAAGYFARVAVPADALFVMGLGLAMVLGQLRTLGRPVATG